MIAGALYGAVASYVAIVLGCILIGCQPPSPLVVIRFLFVRSETLPEDDDTSNRSVRMLGTSRPIARRLGEMPAEAAEGLNAIVAQLFEDARAHDAATRLCDTLNREFAMLEGRSRILDYIHASNLHLGHSPPQLKNIVIMPSEGDGRDLDLRAKIIYTGEFSMEIATQLNLYTILQARLKVAVADMTGNVGARISFPDDSSEGEAFITLAFVEDPHFQLDIHSSVGNFTDVGMVKQLISTTLRSVLRKMLVTPNGIRFSFKPDRPLQKVPIDPTEKKNASSKRRNKTRKQSSPALGRLLVVVGSAINLPTLDSHSSSDAYCILSFNRIMKRTKLVLKRFKWLLIFCSDVTNPQDNLVLTVYYRGKRPLGKDTYVGHVVVPFASLKSDELTARNDPLTRRKMGPSSSTSSTSLLPHPPLQKDASDADFQPVSGVLNFEVVYQPYTDANDGTVSYVKELGIDQFDDLLLEAIPLDDLEETNPQPLHRRQKSSLDSKDLLDKVDDSKRDESFSSDTFVATHVRSTSATSALDYKFIIIMTILHGSSLTACDKSGNSDPYCVIQIGREKRKTKSVRKSLDPTWMEKFIVPVVDIPESVTVDVFDWNLLTYHTFMGRCTIALSPPSDLNDTESTNKETTVTVQLEDLPPSLRDASYHPPMHTISGSITVKYTIETFTATNMSGTTATGDCNISQRNDTFMTTTASVTSTNTGTEKTNRGEDEIIRSSSPARSLFQSGMQKLKRRVYTTTSSASVPGTTTNADNNTGDEEVRKSNEVITASSSVTVLNAVPQQGQVTQQVSVPTQGQVSTQSSPQSSMTQAQQQQQGQQGQQTTKQVLTKTVSSFLKGPVSENAKRWSKNLYDWSRQRSKTETEESEKAKDEGKDPAENVPKEQVAESTEQESTEQKVTAQVVTDELAQIRHQANDMVAHILEDIFSELTKME